MKYTKRMLALLLALCMVFTSVQLPVNAEEDSVVETLAEDVPVEDSVVEDSELDEVTTDEATVEEPVVDESATEETAVEESAEQDSTTEEDVTTDDSEVEDVTESEEVIVEEPSEEADEIEETFEEIVVVEEAVTSYALPRATETDKKVVDAAIIFTDLHSNKSNYKDGTIQEIFGTLKGTGLSFSSVTSGGDAFSVNEDNSSSNGPYNGYTETISTSIRNALGDSDIPVNYVWSDHDRYAFQENDTDTTNDDTTLLDKTSRIVYGLGADEEPGTEDDGNYYVYALSMGDLSSDDRYSSGFGSKRVEKGFTATVEQAIDNFETEVGELKTDRPLFIVAHQPLLARRGDNGYAADWCEAINRVAATRDVAYFFGHNHKYDVTADYYYEKGSEMPVAQNNGDKVGTNTKINFTHMCAGYMEPSSTGSTANTTRQGTVIVATICEDSVNYATYNKAGKFTGTYSVDKTVDREFAANGDSDTPDGPTTPEDTEIIVDGTKINVSGATVTGSSVVSDEDQALINEKNYAGAYVWDIFATIIGEKATLTFPVVAEWQDKADRLVGISVEDGVVQEIEGTYADGFFSFDVTHFSAKGYALRAASVTTSGGDWVEIIAPVGGTTSYVYSLVEEIVAGKEYVIVGNDNPIALMDNAGSMGKQTVDISGDGKTMTSTKELTQWKFSAKTNGTIYNGTRYLRYNSSSFSLNKNNSTSFTITDNGSKFRIQSGKYSFYYDESGWTRSSRNTAEYVRLYEYVETERGGGEPGLYGKITGSNEELTYEVAFGTPQNEALDVVKDDISITYAETTDIDSITDNDIHEYEDDGAGMSWTFDPAYDGNVPGEYAVTISYQGKTLGVAKVVVQEREILSVTIDSLEGSVPYNSNSETKTGSKLTITYAGDTNTTEVIDVTVGMLTEGAFDLSTPNTYGTLTVTYNGETVTYNGDPVDRNYTLIVRGPNNYPEYPDEGAVKVNKTATGVDFQSSGIAQVELSASGVPIEKGADVIIMLDTSSSMNSNKVKDENGNNTSQSRLQVLQQSLNNLITQLKSPGEDGEPLDIRVAIADFNGYYDENTGTPYDQDENDYHGSASYDQDSKAKVYTGSGKLDKDAFVHVSSNALTSPTLTYTSGTNYDYAFDAIYQLGTAIKSDSQEERDLFVIFMSDGAAFQWNYYHSRNNQANWGKWITGEYTTEAQLKAAVSCDDHIYYYDMKDHDNDGMINEHRMANAIKGDPAQRYEVIRKTNAGLSGVLEQVKDNNGNAIENMYTVPGLGASMFTINFDAQTDGSVLYTYIDKSLQSTASDQSGTTKYYYKVKTANQLADAFDVIGAEITYAATNARFVDQMGTNFNLQMKTSNYEVLVDGKKQNKTLSPYIEILEYDIYTKAEADEVPEGTIGDTVTNAMVGTRKGTYKVAEVIMFSTDGTKAYSTLIDVDGNGKYGVTVTKGANGQNTYTIDDSADNILKTDGVIYAKTFWYNSGKNSVQIDGVNIPTNVNSDGTTSGSTKELPAETFYWKLGTVKSTEMAMRYFVYLDGAMEGEKPGGSYQTNEFAVLYYDNYLGNACKKDTHSPVVAWKEANVSYAFYLVDDDGNVVVNQATGETGTFANRIAVTKPVVHEVVMLNNGDSISTLDIISNDRGVLPEGYQLYDYDGLHGATYTVKIGSNSTGSWKITSVKEKNTTYVTQFSLDEAYSNSLTADSTSYDYTHTVVWFAVKWEITAIPDAVVIDYGLPVDIDVLSNDQFAGNGKLTAVGLLGAQTGTYSGTLNNGYGTSVVSAQGTAKVNGEKILYTPTQKDMEMNTKDSFSYAVNYTGDVNSGMYYSTVTVIPATTIYYEDDFLELSAQKKNASGVFEEADITAVWKSVGQSVENAKQEEDRPGKYSLQADANNFYGYDKVYDNTNSSLYSLGSAVKAVVKPGLAGIAEFSFYGTGFDVIGLTNYKTGMLVIQVYKEGVAKAVKNLIVDTYYGYMFNEETHKWEVNPNAKETLYQIPVMKVSNLDYGKYNVKITASHSASMDHTSEEGYELYLDAIRIYDPAGYTPVDTAIQQAYQMDNELMPIYREVRNILLDADSFGTITLDGPETEGLDETYRGAVFIDGKDSGVSITEYKNYGPNNEVYLKDGQAVAFALDLAGYVNNSGESIVGSVQIGYKSADGNPAAVKVYNVNMTARASLETYRVLKSSTDMYFDLLPYAGRDGLGNLKVIVIENPTDDSYNGDISITNIKIGFTTSHSFARSSIDEVVKITPRMAKMTLKAMRSEEVTVLIPEIFKVSTDNVAKKGENTNITVITSQEIAYLYANDTKVPDYVELEDGTRQWIVSLPAENVGEMKVEIVGADKNNFYTEAVITTVEVEENEGNVGNKDAAADDIIEKDKIQVDVIEQNAQNNSVLVEVITAPNADNIVVNGTIHDNYSSIDEDGNKHWEVEVELEEDKSITTEVFDEDGNKIDSDTVVLEDAESKTIIELIIDWIVNTVRNVVNWFKGLFGKGEK